MNRMTQFRQALVTSCRLGRNEGCYIEQGGEWDIMVRVQQCRIERELKFQKSDRSRAACGRVCMIHYMVEWRWKRKFKSPGRARENGW